MVGSLVAVLLALVDALGWRWLAGEWLAELDATYERGSMDRFSGVLFGVVAALAAAQALRQPAPRGGPRWLWVLGWLSAAFFIGLVAFEELHRQVDVGSFIAPLLGLKELDERYRWVLVAAPLAVPPAAAAGWVLLSAQRGHPARALLTVLALALALNGLLLDGRSSHLLVYGALVDSFGFPPAPTGFYEVFEEGAEQMAAAALAVVLVEMLAARPGAAADATGSRRRLAVALAVSAALLAVSAFPLASHRVLKGDGWETDAPWSYAGPIALVEQPFQANQDYLRRIDVWAYVDGGASDTPAEIFARLTPEGSDRPIRESRAEVHGARHSDATVSFHFEPIPESSGKRYTLTVGLLSGPRPFVFLGLNPGDAIPEGDATVNGEPTPFANDLALRTAWSGRFIDGMYPRDLRSLGADRRGDPEHLPVGARRRRRRPPALGTLASIRAPRRLALGAHGRPPDGRHRHWRTGLPRRALADAARVTAVAGKRRQRLLYRLAAAASATPIGGSPVGRWPGPWETR